MFENLFIFWLGAIPLTVWGGFYEAPKVFIYLIGIFFLSVYWIFQYARGKYFNFYLRDYFYLIWLLVLLAASIFGVHPIDSIIGGSYRHQGLIFFLGLWVLGKTVGGLAKNKKILLYKVISWSVLIEALLVIVEIISGRLYFGRPLGTIGEVNAVAGFLAAGFYFVSVSWPTIYLILPGIALLLTESRSGILAGFISLGIILNTLNKKIKKWVFVLIALISFSFILLISLERVSPFPGPEERSVVWTLGIKQILSRPVLGFGVESGEVVYDQTFKKSGILLENFVIDRAHNLFLDVTMWSGIIGLIFFIGFLVESFRSIDSNKKFALLSLLIYAMFQPLSIVHWILLIIIINI